jgi:CheY-like chemotaxis protein
VILVVDDEEFVREHARLILEHQGYEVEEASNGKDGVERVNTAPHKYSAIVLDLIMPVLGGFGAHQAIRNLQPDIPILLSSSYEQHVVARITESDEKTSFLQKPYQSGALIKAMQGLLLLKKQ